MATAGEGATSYEGGGGKFRKRPLRRPQKTPYDRPPTALRNPTSSGWLSKLVDPASKLISASAQMFFSSVFRKRLPPLLPQPPSPPPPPEDNQEPVDELQEAPPMMQSFSQAQEPASDQGRNLTDNSHGSGIFELEQMLTQKSFTRSEIERLTELLHSRTVELPVRDEGKLTEANRSNPPSSIERREVFSFSPMQENRDERNKFPGIMSSPAESSRVLEKDIASPAEVAKAYMGSRPSKVSSPSMLGLRSHTLREDTAFLNDVAFPPKSPIMSLVSKSAVRVGVSENGFMTPRSRGRSAIYSMARTPYSRGYPSVTQKGARSTNYGFAGPSLSPRGWERGGQSGTKQLALKRSSSTLDDDVGSVGPIRRIRQKSNLSTQGTPLRPTQELLSLSGSKHKLPKSVEGNGDNSIASTSYAHHVPSKSSEVAAKILEHLERMTPKEKSSESKLLNQRDKSPTKLTPNMLSGQALRSLEDVDSSKLFKNYQLSPDKDNLPDTRDNTSLNQDKAVINAPKTSDTAASVKDGVIDVKTSNSGVSNVALQPPQKKRAFQMSAREDTQEADDHMHSNGFAFKVPTVGEEGKRNKSPVETKAVTFGAPSELGKTPAVVLVEKTATAADSPLCKGTDSARNTGFMFATSSSQADLIQADKVVPPKDLNASSPNLFTSISKNADKVPPFTFSSASANERLSPKFGFQSDPKPESSKSMGNVTSATSDAQPKILEANNNNTQDAGDLKGNTETLPLSAASTSTTSIFSSSSGVKNSNPNNGSPPSKFSIFSSTGPVLPSSNLSKQMVNNPSFPIPSFTTSTSTTATAPSSPLAPSAPAPAPAPPPSLPAVAPAPFFTFGTSSTQPSTASTTLGTEISDKQKVIGNATGSLFSGSSFGTASTGSSNFAFTSSAAVTSSTASNNQSQALVFSTSGGGSLISAPPVSSSATATVSKSTPFQFGSSSSSVFGASGSTTSFTASASLFGSSGPAAAASGISHFSGLFGSSASAAKLFTSGPTFGNTSSAAASGSSASGSSASSFGSSWQTNNSPLTFGTSFNSPSSSVGFSFGASSSTSAGPANTQSNLFGSSAAASSAPMFSFTSAAATTSSQPIFGNPVPPFSAPPATNGEMNMEDSMAEDHPVQAPTPAVPVFGQPPPPAVLTPPSGFTFLSAAPSPSIPFQFGGQQSQVAPQNPSPFQASGSLEFSGGGSFSLGSGGGDKSGRRIVRPSKSRNRKK